MRFWYMARPIGHEFASVRIHGRWEPRRTDLRLVRGPCPGCGSAWAELAPPFEVEWDPGFDNIGDFTWQRGGGGPLVVDHVARALRERFTGFDLEPVAVRQEPQARRQRHANRQRESQALMPYGGPPLLYLRVAKTVPMDRARSTVSLKRKCGKCSREDWQVSGNEWISYRVESDPPRIVPIRTARMPGQGLFVHATDLAQSHFFRVQEFWGCWVFCVDEVKQFIDHQRFTNVDFLEFGDVI